MVYCKNNYVINFKFNYVFETIGRNNAMMSLEENQLTLFFFKKYNFHEKSLLFSTYKIRNLNIGFQNCDNQTTIQI